MTSYRVTGKAISTDLSRLEGDTSTLEYDLATGLKLRKVYAYGKLGRPISRTQTYPQQKFAREDSFRYNGRSEIARRLAGRLDKSAAFAPKGENCRRLEGRLAKRDRFCPNGVRSREATPQASIDGARSSQLTGALLDENAYAYAYDNIGNRITAQGNTAQVTYTTDVTITASGSASLCCDRTSKKQKLLVQATLSGEASIGLGSSWNGKKYQPRGRGSKWQDARNGRFTKKPGGRKGDGRLNFDLYGGHDCPRETFDGSFSYGVRMSAGMGYGVIVDANQTHSIDEEPVFAANIGIGRATGARVEAYFSVSGSMLYTTDSSA